MGVFCARPASSVRTMQRSQSQRRSFFRRSRCGVSVVEFAVVSPFIFVLIFGLFEFGRIVMVQHAVANAAREGARLLSLSTTQSLDAVKTEVRDQLDATIPGASKDTSSTLISITAVPVDPITAVSGDTVSVNVQVSYSDITWLPGNLLGLHNPTISAESKMERE